VNVNAKAEPTEERGVSTGKNKYPDYMLLKDLKSNPPKVLQQTSQVQMVVHLAIEAFTTELLFVNAFPSENEHLKSYRQILVNIAKECRYTEMVQGIQNDLEYFKNLLSIVCYCYLILTILNTC